MTDRKTTKASKTLSWLLRHGAREAGLARWVPAKCIVELRAMTKRAAAQEAELRRVLFAERGPA